MGFFRETEPTGCRKLEINFKELAHVIVRDGRSEMCRAGPQAGNSIRDLEPRGNLEAEFLLPWEDVSLLSSLKAVE